MELTQEEVKIIEKWRELGAWGELKLTKQEGKLRMISSNETEQFGKKE